MLPASRPARHAWPTVLVQPESRTTASFDSTPILPERRSLLASLSITCIWMRWSSESRRSSTVMGGWMLWPTIGAALTSLVSFVVTTDSLGDSESLAATASLAGVTASSGGAAGCSAIMSSVTVKGEYVIDSLIPHAVAANAASAPSSTALLTFGWIFMRLLSFRKDLSVKSTSRQVPAYFLLLCRHLETVVRNIALP